MAATVLLDARALRADATSNHTYWRELMRALVHSEAPYRWVLASNVPVDTAFLGIPSNWEAVVEGPTNDRLWSIFHLPRMARRIKADLVHVQYTVSPLFRCPVVTTIHDVSYFINPAWLPPRDARLLRITVPYACRKAKAIAVVSDSVKRDLLKFVKVDPGKIFVTPNGAPERSPPGTPGDYVLLVGGFSPRKNWRLALAAVELARAASGRELRLVITGPIRDEVDALPAWVRLAGPVPDDELEELYANALALIHPALYEGFGLTPLEAWAHGTPSIVSSIDPFLDTFVRAESCVEGWDPKDWSAALLQLLQPGVRARRLELLTKVLSSFTWTRTAERTLAAYAYALK